MSTAVKTLLTDRSRPPPSPRPTTGPIQVQAQADKRVPLASRPPSVVCAQGSPPLATIQSQVAATAILNICLAVKQRQQATVPCLGYIEPGPCTNIILHLDPPNQQLPDPDRQHSDPLSWRACSLSRSSFSSCSMVRRWRASPSALSEW
jgi:hypothetical protein